ncbi:hypothetical protein Q31b_22350 [Novipirellula aureliae]|uniref:Uncharacterized protein n=1 Tax=Novipirellula aureliae TaxID=2527966 RepID=A0A5C6E5H0_9BACT|nr:hypothetical protein Q31b_22350 [Novipirellula aureliae]
MFLAVVSGGCFWRLFLAVVSGGCFWRLFLAVVSGGCFSKDPKAWATSDEKKGKPCWLALNVEWSKIAWS